MQQDTPLLYSEDIPCELDHAHEETNQKPPQTTLARDGQTDNLIPICPLTTSHPPKLGYGGCNNNAHTHSLLLALTSLKCFPSWSDERTGTSPMTKDRPQNSSKTWSLPERWSLLWGYYLHRNKSWQKCALKTELVSLARVVFCQRGCGSVQLRLKQVTKKTNSTTQALYYTNISLPWAEFEQWLQGMQVTEEKQHNTGAALTDLCPPLPTCFEADFVLPLQQLLVQINRLQTKTPPFA